MRRIFRSLKLGMKSLLLHKLRSGLTVLGIVFGVAAVISMLAVGEGSGREGPAPVRYRAPGGDQHHHTARSKPSDRGPCRAGGGRRMVLNYGLKYEDFDRHAGHRPHASRKPCRSARSASRSARLSRSSSTAGWSAPPRSTPTSTAWRWKRGVSSPSFRQCPKYENLLPCSPTDDRQGSSSHTKTRCGKSVKLGSDYYTVIGVTTKERQHAQGNTGSSSFGRAGLQQGRLHPPEHLQASGSASKADR